MISIIKIITDNYRPFQLGFSTAEERANKIKSAQDRIIYCGNTISEDEAVALADKYINGGLQNVSIFLSSECCAGAKTREELRALEILLDAETFLNLKYTWGSNLLVVDKASYIFGDEIDTADIAYNCFTLDLGETETLIKSIFKGDDAEAVKQESSISPALINELKKELKERKEYLFEKQRYEFLNSRIEIVTCHLEGIRFLNKTIQLKNPLFEFASDQARNKFKASYRLFDKLEKKAAFDKCADIQNKILDDLASIKQKYLKKTKFGDCILSINKQDFERDIENFNKELSAHKNEIMGGLKSLLEDSIKGLRSMLKEFAEKRIIQIKDIDYHSVTDKDAMIEQIMKSLNVPTPEMITSSLKVDHWYTRLSPELCQKQDFLDQIKANFEPGLSGNQNTD